MSIWHQKIRRERFRMGWAIYLSLLLSACGEKGGDGRPSIDSTGRSTVPVEIKKLDKEKKEAIEEKDIQSVLNSEPKSMKEIMGKKDTTASEAHKDSTAKRLREFKPVKGDSTLLKYFKDRNKK